jgi:hypothetical protein
MPDLSHWQAELDYHRVHLEARSHRNSFYEKLALLDGGTVALVITAVLGPLHGIIKHKYLLCIGLSFLVLAMLTLLRRNLLAVEFEFHAAAKATRDPAYLGDTAAQAKMTKLSRSIYRTESAGVVFSAVGLVVLLIEIWLILV